jgi:xanthine dehydrogenase YagR molybdenum-binding subunit
VSGSTLQGASKTGAVGAPITRVDGHRKVTGAAKYAAELGPRAVAHAVAVQSTIAKGTIAAIDTSAARRAPGVLAVLTHQNAPKIERPKSDAGAAGGAQTEFRLGEDIVPLSGVEIHFAGQYVALVVAKTLEQARRGARLVRVGYREERPVLEIASAMDTAERPPKVFGRDLQHSRGDAAAALASAAVKHEATYTTPVETHNPMELSGAVAEWKGDRLTVWDATQAVIADRAFLAQAFGLPKENVRVVCPFTGGAFGCKGFQWPHTLLAAMAAKSVGRPVRLIVSRAQMFTSVGHRPNTIQKLALGADRDGKLTAVVHETTNPTSPITQFIEPAGIGTSAMLYACENASIPATVVRVNIAAGTPMRAPGETPGTFAIESAMDELAVALDMDPVALRVRNHADTDPTEKKPFSSKHLKECYALGAEKFGWKSRDPRPGSMKDGDLLVGWGMATAVYPGRRRPASAKIRMTPDGRANVRAATQDLGTGAYTIFTQISADALGVPIENVVFELGDTDFPRAEVSGGSTTSASVSEAILAAAVSLRKSLGAADGDATPIAELVRRAGRVAEAEATAKPPDAKDQKSSIHSFGAQFCEVKVDPLLPCVQVTRWVSVMNVGRVLNPKTARSQVLGGVTMGIGMALLEHTAYDPRTGRPVTASLADYLVPVNADIGGGIDVYFVGEPDPDINSLGCRGVGEIGITGAAAAVANAVYHATGKRVRDLPITPDKLL